MCSPHGRATLVPAVATGRAGGEVPVVLGMKRIPSPRPPDKRGYSRAFRALNRKKPASEADFSNGGLLNRTQEVAGFESD